MKKIIFFVARIIVAATFLFSGFVKLVDPLGSSYKFEEYFGADVLNLEFLIPFALPLSVFLILTEILLGVTLLIGYKEKITTWSLFAITLLFLFLTWYSAYYNKVTDCGCFGDALKLGTWETFYKNVVLIILIVFLLVNSKILVPIFTTKLSKLIVITSLGGFLFITYYVLMHLPIIDFRAYAVGKDLVKGMEYIEGSDELPPVHDFYLESETEDLTATILAAEKALLVVAYDFDKSSPEGLASMKDLALQAKKNGYLVYGLSASATQVIEEAKKDYSLPFEFLFCDGTTLKTIIRANPGVVILEKGIVTGKWSWVDVDSVFSE